tara:strand:- start:4386 stop:4763 length:378 start_codon:yes stop_codon:yes gene_type:complete
LGATKSIDLNNYLAEIDIANTFELRKKGLMNIKNISDDYGMFFAWDYSKTQCMWMKNTPAKLDVAFINKDGKIIEIHYLEPFSEESVCSSKPALYALEVRKDWFKHNKIEVGDIININNILSNDN